MAETLTEHVLRIPRTDSEGDYILLNITRHGPSPLDLRLIATEGEQPYVTTSIPPPPLPSSFSPPKLGLTTDTSSPVKHAEISKHRDKKSPQSATEWESLLLHRLLQQPPNTTPSTPPKIEPNTKPSPPSKVSLTSTLNSTALTLIFRRNISGITQRLGEISLPLDESQEIDTVSWALTSLARSERLEADLNALTSRYEEQKTQVGALMRQLDELIAAKEKHEEVLFVRFRDLLNAKKLMIRDQQRVLAGAKLDRTLGREVRRARKEARQLGGEGEKGKIEEVELEEEEGFESRGPERRERQETVDRSDEDVTEDEDEDEDAVLDRVRAGRVEREVKSERMQLDTPPLSRKAVLGGDGAGSQPVAQVPQHSSLDHEAGNEEEDTEDDDDEL